jgi:hypothetical protein
MSQIARTRLYGTHAAGPSEAIQHRPPGVCACSSSAPGLADEFRCTHFKATRPSVQLVVGVCSHQPLTVAFAWLRHSRPKPSSPVEQRPRASRDRCRRQRWICFEISSGAGSCSGWRHVRRGSIRRLRARYLGALPRSLLGPVSPNSRRHHLADRPKGPAPQLAPPRPTAHQRGKVVDPPAARAAEAPPALLGLAVNLA